MKEDMARIVASERAMGDNDGPHVPLPQQASPVRVVPAFPLVAYLAMVNAEWKER